MNIDVYHFLLFIFGACWGSFLNVCIIRVSNGKSIILPSSSCFKCNNKINFFDKIPILSWILLLGKCRCKMVKIPKIYLFMELFVAVLTLCIVFAYSLSPLSLIYGIFFSLLIVGSGVDIKQKWIPDTVTIGGIFFGLVCSYIFPKLHGCEVNIDSLILSIKGFLVGSSILLFIGIIGKLILKTDAMGMGDVKLLGAIGTFVGIEGIFFCLFTASLIALIISQILFFMKKRSFRDEIPFGPYLSVSCIIWILFNLSNLNLFTFGNLFY